MCLVAWDKLTRPKALGGLGIRDIQVFHTALVAKQAWRIITNPDCLLARVVKGKYCTKAHFLNVPEAKSISHGWRGILAGRDLLATNLGKVIGNGEGTRVWKDPWLSTELPMVPIGSATETAQDLFVSDLMCRGRREWNTTRISSIIPPQMAQIIRIQPSITDAPDSYAWLANKSGTYSVKSGYYAAMAKRRESGDREITEAQQQ